jgi:UDP-glucose 4-epimerase
VNQVLAILEEISGMKVRRLTMPAALGDPRHTGASINLARERLGWEPRVSLREGLTRQWTWFRDMRLPHEMRASSANPSGSSPGNP